VQAVPGEAPATGIGRPQGLTADHDGAVRHGIGHRVVDFPVVQRGRTRSQPDERPATPYGRDERAPRI